MTASRVEYGGVSGFSEIDGGLQDDDSDAVKEVVVGGAGASFEGETGTDGSGISTDVRIQGRTSNVSECRIASGAQDEIDNVTASLAEYGGLGGFSEGGDGLKDIDSDEAKEILLCGAGAAFEGATYTYMLSISTDVRVEGRTSNVSETLKRCLQYFASCQSQPALQNVPLVR
jgi:hypothetical protein